MPFEKSVLVPLGADETFALITQPDRLRRWKAITARVDLRAGGDYRWTIIPGHSACGTFTEVEPGRRVVFTWGWEGDTALPPGASTVTITLEPAEGGTIVRLVHDGLTGEQAAMHGEGWTHYLGRLAEAGTRGDAGADEWAAVPQHPDAIAAAEATLAVCQLVLRGVANADYDRATVCPEFSVAQLADHLIGSVTFVGGLCEPQGRGAAWTEERGTSDEGRRRLKGAPEASGSTASAQFPPTAATALEARLAAAAQPALEAWNHRGLDGTVKVGSGEMPAAAALGILSVEFLVHAWDFARATGQHVTVPEGLAAHVLDVAGQIITPELRSGGNFADAVPADPDAGVMDRLIAFTGRYVPVGGTSST